MMSNNVIKVRANASEKQVKWLLNEVMKAAYGLPGSINRAEGSVSYGRAEMRYYVQRSYGYPTLVKIHMLGCEEDYSGCFDRNEDAVWIYLKDKHENPYLYASREDGETEWHVDTWDLIFDQTA